MKTISAVILIYGIIFTSFSKASEETCKSSQQGIQTEYGRLISTDCFNEKGKTTRQSLSLDGKKIIETDALFRDDFSKSRGIWIYSGDAQWETGCPDRLYLIDLAQKPVKVIAFGVKKACNEFHWASWGEKRSVIALKHNVKFTYEKGKMILPKAGEKLWKAIEPPHAGEGLSEEDAIPFAENVPLPE